MRAGDTVMGGNTYAKVYEPGASGASADTSASDWIGGIRQDASGKVWYRGFAPSRTLYSQVEDPQRTGLSMGPNPAKDHIRLALKHASPLGKYSVRVFNVQGQQLGVWKIVAGQKLQIDKQELGNGLFYFQLWDADFPIDTGKFIFQ